MEQEGAQQEDIYACAAEMLFKHGMPMRADPEFLPDNLKAMLHPLQKRAEIVVRRANAHLPAGRRCDAKVIFCDEPSFGAFAAAWYKNDFIVLNVGLVPTLLDFFQRMMATKGLWPDFGDQSTLTESAPFDPPKEFRAHMFWNSLPARAPSDGLRLALATVFMNECFDYIVRHELAHLALGHLRDDVKPLRADPGARQSLEFFADGHSALWGLEPLFDMPRKIDQLHGSLGEAYKEFHRTPDDTFTNYLLVIFFALRLMDETEWTEDDFAKKHPPAPMRFHGVCIHLVEHFKRAGDTVGEERALRAIEHIWEHGEHIFCATLGIAPNPNIKRLTFSQLSEDHYERMSEKTRSLPPHLFDLGHDQPGL